MCICLSDSDQVCVCEYVCVFPLVPFSKDWKSPCAPLKHPSPARPLRCNICAEAADLWRMLPVMCFYLPEDRLIGRVLGSVMSLLVTKPSVIGAVGRAVVFPQRPAPANFETEPSAARPHKTNCMGTICLASSSSSRENGFVTQHV